MRCEGSLSIGTMHFRCYGEAEETVGKQRLCKQCAKHAKRIAPK